MSTNLRQSFRLKLCVTLFCVSIVTFLIIFAMSGYLSYLEEKSDVNDLVNAKLDYAIRSLDEELTVTETATVNLSGVLTSPLVTQRPDSIMSLFRHFLQDNPHVQGVAMGYEPGVVNNDPRGCAPYVMRENNKFTQHNLALIKDYRNADWYKTTKECGKPYWSEPFVETNGTIIISYCLPIQRGGSTIGVLAVDLAHIAVNNHVTF